MGTSEVKCPSRRRCGDAMRCGDAALTQVCNPREREPSTSRSRHGERATEVEMPRGDWEPIGAMTNAWARREARNGGEARQFRYESSVFQIRSITQEYSSACRSLGASSLCPFAPPQRHARAGWAGLWHSALCFARSSALPSLVFGQAAGQVWALLRAVARHRHLACTLARWQASVAKGKGKEQKAHGCTHCMHVESPAWPDRSQSLLSTALQPL